ncbi:putative transcriptional regulatory protein [Metarhizium anisopliae]
MERVDVLEKRLGEVENKRLVEAEDPQPRGADYRTTLESPMGGLRADVVPSMAEPTAGTSPYQGHSSFDDLSIQAAEFAKQATDIERHQDGPDVETTLDTLRLALRDTKSTPSTADYQFNRVQATSHGSIILPLPHPVFLSSYAINDPALVEDLSRQVYFPTNAVTIGHITALHAVLYFLLREHITLSTALCKDYDLKPLLDKCEQNVNSGLETYDVFAVPSFENLLALTMGMIKAQEETKPLLCTTFISAAASQCQRLGYHREITYRNDQTGRREHMRRLFWTVYVFDKNMSLLQGHSSHMQDFEIDAKYPALSPIVGVRPWDESFIVAIKLARIQGQIYNNLYSTMAIKSSSPDREQHINTLQANMHESSNRYRKFNVWRVFDGLELTTEQIDPSLVNHRQIFVLSRKHWDVMYYSTLTSLLRGSLMTGSVARISTQCFHAARLCLQSHMQCFSGYLDSGFLEDKDYANWVLHCSSFSSFVVIFLHAVAGSRMDDVELLDDMVGILHKCQASSKTSERLFQVCGTFAKLARQLVEARNSCVGTYSRQQDSLQLDIGVHRSEAMAGETM